LLDGRRAMSDTDRLPDRGFADGTRLFTARGEVPVEQLGPGDLLVTLSGRGAPLKPVAARVEAPGAAVRLAPGALGAGIPAREMVVGAAQILRVEGLLLPARQLVNGTTIAEQPAVALHRLVLATDDLLIAEGTPAAALPEPAEIPADPARLAAIRAALGVRGGAADPRDALLDGLIAGEEMLSASSALRAGAAPAALGPGLSPGLSPGTADG
jgi:hypothetical protein